MIVYICHPIANDVLRNLEQIRLIVRRINLEMPDVVPFCPYWLDCNTLDDSIPDQRARGIANSVELFKRVRPDEMWLYGNRISHGMSCEISLAMAMGIPVVGMTDETRDELLNVAKWS